MAVSLGISKINGVAIGNVAKTGGVTKANIWSLSGEQRQASLFRTLQNADWGSYTPGKNSASFTAVGNNSRAFVYFENTAHSRGQVYNFSFTKDSTDGGKTWACVVSSNATFNATGQTSAVAIPTAAGATSLSVTASVTPNGTAYIGIVMDTASSTDSIQVTDLIVT